MPRINSNYTITPADEGLYFAIDASANDVTVTLPSQMLNLLKFVRIDCDSPFDVVIQTVNDAIFDDPCPVLDVEATGGASGNPLQVTIAENAEFVSGSRVYIDGIPGFVGFWTITRLSPTVISLNGSFAPDPLPAACGNCSLVFQALELPEEGSFLQVSGGSGQGLTPEVDRWYCTAWEDQVFPGRGARVVLHEDLELFIRVGGTGVDPFNEGPGAFGSWQDLDTYAVERFDCNGHDIIYAQDMTASMPDIYAGGASSVLSITKPLYGSGRRRIRGSPGAADDVRFTTDPGVTGMFVSSNQDVGTIVFEDKLMFVTGGLGVDFRAPCQVDIQGQLSWQGAFPACLQTSQNGVYVANNGLLVFDGVNCDYFLRLDSCTFHDNGAMEVLGAPAVSAFARLDFFSQGYLGEDVTGSYTGGEIDARQGVRYDIRVALGTPSSRGNAQPGCVITRGTFPYNRAAFPVTFAGANEVDVVFANENIADQLSTAYMVTVGGGAGSTQYKVLPAERLLTGFKVRATAVNSDTVWCDMQWIEA